MVVGLAGATLRSVLDDLVNEAVRVDVSHEATLLARDATSRVLGCGLESALSAAQRRRAEAYFRAVVRRHTVRGGAGPRASARFVAAAVVADLRESGRDGSAIWLELERGWRNRFPADLLEEYRLRLCG